MNSFKTSANRGGHAVTSGRALGCLIKALRAFDSFIELFAMADLDMEVPVVAFVVQCRLARQDPVTSGSRFRGWETWTLLHILNHHRPG